MNSTAPVTYMNKEKGPLPFCPGCGHEKLLHALDKALVKLGRDPKDVVIVTDIGCIGLTDPYFVTNTFHGLHGRSLTYATGLKLAQPGLTVIVLIGDGGCGIGGAHLLNAARRNVDVTLIVANNFNYGMTGGQHSVTTPVGGVTATTPGGNIEGSMDICATVMGAGAGWTYRGIGYDKDLPDRMVDGIQYPGFALLDVWELCTAYYLPLNDFNKRDLYELIDRCNMEVGVLNDTVRPEFGAENRKLFGRKAKTKPLVIDKKFNAKLDRQAGIVIAGSAGQKVKSAATIFGRAGMLSGLQSTQKDDYPITVMTGHSLSEINLSPDTIDYTAIESPEYFIVISEDGLKKTRKEIQRLSESCKLFVEESLEPPETSARIYKLPFVAAAKKVGRLSIGFIAFGAVIKDSGMIPLAAFEEAIARFQEPKISETNINAARNGAEMLS